MSANEKIDIQFFSRRGRFKFSIEHLKFKPSCPLAFLWYVGEHTHFIVTYVNQTFCFGENLVYRQSFSNLSRANCLMYSKEVNALTKALKELLSWPYNLNLWYKKFMIGIVELVKTSSQIITIHRTFSPFYIHLKFPKIYYFIIQLWLS